MDIPAPTPAKFVFPSKYGHEIQDLILSSPSSARLYGFLNQQLELGVVASNSVLALGVSITS